LPRPACTRQRAHCGTVPAQQPVSDTRLQAKAHQHAVWFCAPTSCSSSSLSAHLTLLLPLSFAIIGSKRGRCACDRVRVLCQAHTPLLGAASQLIRQPVPIRNFCCTRGIATPRSEEWLMLPRSGRRSKAPVGMALSSGRRFTPPTTTGSLQGENCPGSPSTRSHLSVFTSPQSKLTATR
jgi:hypothetical protein